VTGCASLFGVHRVPVFRSLWLIDRLGVPPLRTRKMPRRELLSPVQRESLLAIPTDRADLMEHYILSEQDLAFIRQRRGAK